MNQRSSSFMILAALMLVVATTTTTVVTAQSCGDIRRCSECLDAGCASSNKVCMETCSMARDGYSCYVSTDYEDLDSDSICVIARDEEEAAAGDDATDDDADTEGVVESVFEEATNTVAPDEDAEGDLPEDEVEELGADFGANATAVDEAESLVEEVVDDEDEDGEEEDTKADKDDKDATADEDEDEDEDEDDGDEEGPGMTIARAEGSQQAVSGALSVGQWVSLVMGACAMMATAISN